MAFNKYSLKISSLCLVGSAAAAAAASGIADTLSILLFAAAFAAGCFVDTARLRRLIPPRSFAFAAIIYLCFTPIDYFLLSPDWQRVFLHAIWFTAAVKLVTRANDKDWPPLYLLGSIQWILAASRPTGTIFWICFAAFIVSGISSLMFFELRRLACMFHEDSTAENHRKISGQIASGNGRAASAVENNNKKSFFPFRVFFAAVIGITSAVAAASIPLFFFFPRLPVKSGAPPPSDAVSSFADSIEDVETIELGHEYPPAQQPDAVVMRVKTDVSEESLPFDLKWRGFSFDYYDGRTWTLRRREQLPIATQGGFYKLEESALGSELLRQTFFMEETLTNKIFAAHRALAVSTAAGFLRRDSSDNLSAQNPAQGRKDYIVVSDTIYPDANRISDWTPVPDGIRSAWLQLPELDPRVVQLAREVTGAYRRQYDKARALEAWLGSHYGYTERLPAIYKIPENGDPLAVFLFDAREGHCEYFATAMTVMLRAIGIPARMTSGFLAGEYNPIGGSWTVRRKHSHTWTEAWFPPYGWVEFDATPMEEFPAEPPRARFFANLADAAGLWWRENVAGYDAARQYSIISGFFNRVNQAQDRAGEYISSSANRARAVFRLLPEPAASVKFTALIVLCCAVLLIFILRRTKRRVSGVFRQIKQNPRHAAADFYMEALIFLKARGFVPEKAQTPMEFAQSLALRFHENSIAATALLDLTLFYNEARFGDPAVPFKRAKARALLRLLRDQLK
jgi:transglutaminase-like putative cysteine protease